MRLVVKFDGGCSMQRGIGSGAAVLYDVDGAELDRGARFLTSVTTPVCEYVGLHVGLELAARHAGAAAGHTTVLALGDAELIVRQVDGRYACRKAHLLPLLERTRTLMSVFWSCEVRELPKAGPQRKRRWGNVEADALAGRCMEEMRDL